jgi:hypothetical protein
MMKKIFAMVIMMLMLTSEISAQCAMCRSTLENNFSNGNPGIAAGINTGILYLLSMPYMAVMVIAYLWYKSSRNGKRISGGVA